MLATHFGEDSLLDGIYTSNFKTEGIYIKLL